MNNEADHWLIPPARRLGHTKFAPYHYYVGRIMGRDGSVIEVETTPRFCRADARADAQDYIDTMQGKTR